MSIEKGSPYDFGQPGPEDMIIGESLDIVLKSIQCPAYSCYSTKYFKWLPFCIINFIQEILIKVFFDHEGYLQKTSLLELEKTDSNLLGKVYKKLKYYKKGEQK